MSYAGTLAVTIIADPDAVPDLPVLRDALQDELDGYALLAADSATARRAAVPATRETRTPATRG